MIVTTAMLPIIMARMRTLSRVSSGGVSGPNESNTGPIKKKNKGRVAPVIAAKIQPTTSWHFSEGLARLISLLKGTWADLLVFLPS
jgi:hypothetical protein